MSRRRITRKHHRTHLNSSATLKALIKSEIGDFFAGVGSPGEPERRAAAAKWQQLQRGAASFSITLARGRAELYPEMHGTVTGFKSEIDNQDWIIAKAEHTIDNSGFTTQLELEAKIPEWIAETE